MADVLIVCVREDEPQAKSLADMFERAGFSVGGAPANDAALRSSGAAVVVWSQASIRSRPFLDAAQRVVSADKAVLACLIEPPPGESVKDAPAFELTGWTGDPDDPVLDPLFFSVDRMVNTARAAIGAAPPQPAQAAAAAYDPPAREMHREPPRALRAPPTTPPYARPARTAPPETRQPPPPTLPPGFQMRSPPSAAPMPRHAGAAHAPAPASDKAAEIAHWRAIRNSTDPTDFLDFLNKHGPDSDYAELAQHRLLQLDGTAAPAAPARADVRAAAASAKPARGYEPTRRIEPAPERRREAPLPRALERERPPPQRLEPTKGRGGGVGGFLLVLLLIGAAIAGGVYFGLGDEAMKLITPTAQQESAATAGDDPYPTVEDPIETIENEPASYSISDVAEPPSARPAQTSTRQPPPQRPQPATPRTTPTAAATPDEATPEPFSWTGAGSPNNGQTSQSASAGGPTSLMNPSNGATAPATGQEVSLLPASSSPAATPPPPPASVGWARRPTAQSVGALYPRRALREGQNGFVTLDCVVRADLQVSCTVASESPLREGFGRAALEVSRDYRARATLSDGSSAVGARARIQVNFRSPQ